MRMGWLVRLADRTLRYLYGIFEYWEDPKSIFRARLTTAPHAMDLPDRKIKKGDPVVDLHFWNERFPPIPEGGPDVGWGLRVHRMLQASFRRLAFLFESDPRFNDREAICGVTVLISHEGGPTGEELFKRLGFTMLPYRSPLGPRGIWFENLYTWLLMGAYNQVSLQYRRYLSLQRHEVWMSRETLLRIYGGRT